MTTYLINSKQNFISNAKMGNQNIIMMTMKIIIQKNLSIKKVRFLRISNFNIFRKTTVINKNESENNNDIHPEF